MKLEFAIERIDLSVNEQSMRLLGNNELVANSVNYVYAHFRFPDEWKDLTKQVHFKQALPTAIHLILFLDGNNSVLVPHEVLDHKGEFTVHLVGTGNGVTITTNPLTVYIRDNGLLTPDNNATPTPDFLIESVAIVKEDRDAVEADREHVDELVEQLPQIIADSIVPAAEKAANEVKESIISTVQETADSAVETVNATKDNAISTITTTSESAVNSVTVIKTTSLNAIENARGEVMEELGELVGQATSEADRATTKATEANASAVLAGEHESSARGYSTSAGASATTATTKANEAKGYAESASADASSVAAWNNKVYVGNTAPSESNVSIWINPDEDDPPDIVEQVNQQSDDIVDLQRVNAEQQRQINFLKDITEGVAWRKETDTEEAYTKQIPKGAKGVTINSIGGKCLVVNQVFKNIRTLSNGVTISTDEDGVITLNGTVTNVCVNFTDLRPLQNKAHRYFLRLTILNNPANFSIYYGRLNRYGSSTSKISSGTSYNLTSVEDITKGASSGLSGFTVGDVLENFKVRIEEIDADVLEAELSADEINAMFPNYIPYTEPTIKTICCDSISVGNRNMWHDISIQEGAYINASGEITQNVNFKYTDLIKVEAGESYSFSAIMGGASSVTRIHAYDSNGKWLQQLAQVQVNTNEKILLPNFVIPNNCVYIRISLQNDVRDIQLEKGKVITDFVPYTEQTLTIPQVVKELEGYGFGLNGVSNETRLDSKVFNRKIARVDLGSLNYTYDSGVPRFRTNLNSYGCKNPATDWVYSNLLCEKYSADRYAEIGAKDKIMALSSAGYFAIHDNTFTNANDLKASLQGVYLYYELAEPQEIPIADLLADFENNTECEGNGSITFKNTLGEDYRVPIPNELEYYVKVSEAL